MHLLDGSHTHKLSRHVAIFYRLLQCQLAKADPLVAAALGSSAASVLQLLRGRVPIIGSLRTDVTACYATMFPIVLMTVDENYDTWAAVRPLTNITSE